MKVTLSDIVNFNNSIQSFLSKKIPLQGAFKLNQIIKSTSDSYSFYTEKLNEIIMKYSEKDEQNIPKFDESGQNILIQKDYIQECKDKLNELLNIEVDIDDKNTISLKDLGNLDCTIQELQGLSPFLREE